MRLNQIYIMYFESRIQWPVIKSETFQFRIEYLRYVERALFYSDEIDSSISCGLLIIIIIIKMTHDSDIAVNIF